jgi:hypothetical protein
MDRLKRAALMTRLLQNLKDKGSWCGETHTQKATFFVQHLMDVPLGFEFILYKHGPFSFDLRDELTSLRADGLIRLVPRWPYGPTIMPTELAKKLQNNYQRTLFLFPSSSLGTQLCRSSSFGSHDAVPKPELGNEGNSISPPLVGGD